MRAGGLCHKLKSRDLSVMSTLPSKALSSKTDSLNVPVIVLHVMLACHCLYREKDGDGEMLACHCLYRERGGRC